jgi:hypothetical protein
MIEGMNMSRETEMILTKDVNVKSVCDIMVLTNLNRKQEMKINLFVLFNKIAGKTQSFVRKNSDW